MYIYVFIFLYFIFNCDIFVYLIMLYTFGVLTEELPFLKLDDIIFVKHYVVVVVFFSIRGNVKIFNYACIT